MSSQVPNPEEQNNELSRLVAANRTRLARLQETIANLKVRTKQRPSAKAPGKPSDDVGTNSPEKH